MFTVHPCFEAAHGHLQTLHSFWNSIPVEGSTFIPVDEGLSGAYRWTYGHSWLSVFQPWPVYLQILCFISMSFCLSFTKQSCSNDKDALSPAICRILQYTVIIILNCKHSGCCCICCEILLCINSQKYNRCSESISRLREISRQFSV